MSQFITESDTRSGTPKPSRSSGTAEALERGKAQGATPGGASTGRIWDTRSEVSHSRPGKRPNDKENGPPAAGDFTVLSKTSALVKSFSDITHLLFLIFSMRKGGKGITSPPIRSRTFQRLPQLVQIFHHLGRRWIMVRVVLGGQLAGHL